MIFALRQRRRIPGHAQYQWIVHVLGAVQKQAYTNEGFIFGDWIGRESKGGQAWLTYHLSGNEWVQLEYRNAKAAKDFIPGGTTQNLVKVDVLKRFGKNLEVNAWVQYEGYKAPVIATGKQSDTIGAGADHLVSEKRGTEFLATAVGMTISLFARRRA